VGKILNVLAKLQEIRDGDLLSHINPVERTPRHGVADNIDVDGSHLERVLAEEAQ